VGILDWLAFLGILNEMCIIGGCASDKAFQLVAQCSYFSDEAQVFCLEVGFTLINIFLFLSSELSFLSPMLKLMDTLVCLFVCPQPMMFYLLNSLLTIEWNTPISGINLCYDLCCL